jgi:hypothetical protein
MTKKNNNFAKLRRYDENVSYQFCLRQVIKLFYERSLSAIQQQLQQFDWCFWPGW